MCVQTLLKTRCGIEKGAGIFTLWLSLGREIERKKGLMTYSWNIRSCAHVRYTRRHLRPPKLLRKQQGHSGLSFIYLVCEVSCSNKFSSDQNISVPYDVLTPVKVTYRNQCSGGTVLLMVLWPYKTNILFSLPNNYHPALEAINHITDCG